MNIRRLLPLALLACLALVGLSSAENTLASSDKNDRKGDSLYVGDFGGHPNPPAAQTAGSVARFDAETGDSQGIFVAPASGGLFSPNGLVFDGKKRLLVADQKVFQPVNGEILRYKRNGDFLDALVSSPDPHLAPLAPDGIIIYDHKTLFVADQGDSPDRSGNRYPGQVLAYDAKNGDFKFTLDTSGFSPEFHPRGLVIGPDDLLYVSVINVPFPSPGGAILRFDPETGKFVDIFVESDVTNDLQRPDGLVFSPNGKKLYVTSFCRITAEKRCETTDTNKILIFGVRKDNGLKKAYYVDKIDLSASEAQGGKPESAQAILFGPKGCLYVPISRSALYEAGPDVGSVRRYNVSDKTFDVIVPAGTLYAPRYLSFSKTDPGTLAYEDRHGHRKHHGGRRAHKHGDD